MKTDDLELPIGYVPITGPGVDAIESRKEIGSPIDLEDTLRAPSPLIMQSVGDLVRRLNEYIAKPR